MSDEQVSDEQVEPLAVTVGGTIAATTTIDAIMTALYPTRSADITGTPIYTWIGDGPPKLAATWPAAATLQGQCVQMIARFEVHNVLPSTVGV